MNQLLHVSASPHIKDRVTTSSIMLDVIIALIPATLFGIIQFKINALLIIVTTITTCVLAEYLYERFMKRLANKQMDSQMIMPPVILSVNMREQQVLVENMDIFKSLGYEIEEFGGNEYKVTGMPSNLPKVDCKQLLIDMLDNLVDDSNRNTPEIITERIASMSCKAAVKGNNRLSMQEAKELMKELMEADNPYNCPHGRPTLIMMTKYEIEKKFKRIL